jgi:hypothetical protein
MRLKSTSCATSTHEAIDEAIARGHAARLVRDQRLADQTLQEGDYVEHRFSGWAGPVTHVGERDTNDPTRGP